ncbi:hypothetical protein IMCC26134_08755 [Verrucomicrobia bacterium IMCC26134]|nr:hypothetical protein IMCC26134_08755 [Verrucomicrobia bacterium IMCC26134]
MRQKNPSAFSLLIEDTLPVKNRAKNFVQFPRLTVLRRPESKPLSLYKKPGGVARFDPAFSQKYYWQRLTIKQARPPPIAAHLADPYSNNYE